MAERPGPQSFNFAGPLGVLRNKEEGAKSELRQSQAFVGGEEGRRTRRRPLRRAVGSLLGRFGTAEWRDGGG